jgi:hypothetical protein
MIPVVNLPGPKSAPAQPTPGEAANEIFVP